MPHEGLCLLKKRFSISISVDPMRSSEPNISQSITSNCTTLSKGITALNSKHLKKIKTTYSKKDKYIL